MKGPIAFGEFDPTRRTAFVAGLLYLVTFAASIPAVFLLDPVLTDPSWVVSGANPGQVRLGALLDLVNAFACVGTAVVLYPVVRRVHEGLALGFVTSRMFEAAVIAVGVIAVVTLHGQGATEASIPVAHALVEVRNWTFVLGPGMAGLNALLIGSLMYRGRLIPRWIPAIGLVGGPIYLSSVVAIVLGITEPGGIWQGIGGLSMFAWELLFGLWLVFRGFDRRAPVIASAIAEAGA
jgi:hypothetical protein